MEMLRHPIVLLWLTITFYWAVNLLRVRTGSMFVNPVVCTTAVVILYLKLAGIDYAAYHNAAQFIDFWLKPRWKAWRTARSISLSARTNWCRMTSNSKT